MTIQDLLDEVKRGVYDKSVEVFWSGNDKSIQGRSLQKVGEVEILNGYIVLTPGDK